MEDVGYDFLVKIKKKVGNFKVNGVYWCGSKHIRFDDYYGEPYPTSIIPAFKDQKKALIVRGGIGDLLALSILHDLTDEVTVLTTKSLYPILDWWATVPKKKHFQEPLWMVNYPNKVEAIAGQYGQLVGDQLIAQGSSKNWYEVMSAAAGRPFIHGRPQLKDRKPNLPDRLTHPSILIVNQATSVNRSAELTCIQSAVRQSTDMEPYYYDENRLLNGKHKTTLDQYLSDLYYADFVISVDTSAIHFREGIGKPALGLYSSFSVESRNKYYKFTQSVDIQSPCEIQPCFKNLERCPMMKASNTFAPCLSSTNETFIDQVAHYLKQIL